jgi:hypothetical protein
MLCVSRHAGNSQNRFPQLIELLGFDKLIPDTASYTIMKDEFEALASVYDTLTYSHDRTRLPESEAWSDLIRRS